MNVGEELDDITQSMICDMNILPKADGSCIFCQNGTVMAVAVYGPVETKPKLHKMCIDKTTIEVYFNTICGQSRMLLADNFYELFISYICQKSVFIDSYPRKVICIKIQELQNSGLALSCCINAVCLALIHSGIKMRNLFAAVTCPMKSDVISELPEEKIDETSITFVFESETENVMVIDHRGKLLEDEYMRCLKMCKKSSGLIFTFYRDMIKKNATKT